MSGNAVRFRTSFKSTKKNMRWFPGHMFRGMRVMEHKIKTVDCIVEVHDARIPFSGRNSDFKRSILGVKPHILVLNKADLIDSSHKNDTINKLESTEGIQHVMFTNFKDKTDQSIQQLLPKIKNLIQLSDRFNRNEVIQHTAMIIGVPNIGKSTIINTLRNKYLKKRKAARVGAIAGITRSVSEKIRVYDDPRIYLLDTPGILMPKIKDIECGFRLAACGIFKDHLVGIEEIADYLLYWMNKHNNFNYLELCGLDQPSDNILEVLLKMAVLNKWYLKIKGGDGRIQMRPDLGHAATHLVKEFRSGNLGKLFLDDDILQKGNL